MTILRVFANEVDLSIPGAVSTVDPAFFDDSRVTQAFSFIDGQTSSVDSEPAAGADTWYHFRMVHGSTASSWDGITMQIKDPSGNIVALMTVSNGSPNFSAVGDTTATTLTQVISSNTQYSIDVKVSVTPANVSMSAYINNNLIGTQTVSNTSGNRTNPTRVTFANPDNVGPLYISEGIIADEDTRGFRVRELRPQSFGVDQAWAGSANDVVDNDLATGISTPTTGARTSFGVSNLQNITAGDIVNRVVAQTYAQRGATGLTRINHYFRYPDTTRQDGPDITIDTTGSWYLTEFLNNPSTSAPWDPADLIGIQIGVRAQT